MNPRETAEITRQITELRRQRNVTVVVIEHDMRVVKGVSDRVIAIDYGRKIAEGPYAEVSNNEQVIEAYLGRRATESA
jgi:branched-chain amino acid transport system ATP-binding protein